MEYASFTSKAVGNFLFSHTQNQNDKLRFKLLFGEMSLSFMFDRSIHRKAWNSFKLVGWLVSKHKRVFSAILNPNVRKPIVALRGRYPACFKTHTTIIQAAMGLKPWWSLVCF